MTIIQANGASIPALGFGTYQLTGSLGTDMVATALNLGYRHIDTARMYENEAEVGKGVMTSGVPREEIFLTTKIWPSDFGHDDFLRSAKQSVKNLGTVPDLLLLHWPSKSIPLDETMAALAEAQQRGLTRFIGVSNFTIPLLRLATELSPIPLVNNQIEYHPYLSQDALLPFHRKLGIATTAHCPSARGKIMDEPVIREIAEAHGMNPIQVGLRWLIQQEGVAAIPRTSSEKNAKSNLKVLDFQLTDEEMRKISALRSTNYRICDFEFSPVWDAAA
ncbi:MAG TPA: aldo/keto reductase [Geminicoccus sp.]|jgi:diketogulonate reductase-like aldo/keto reductase|uniref:aldo/keto reductase n=1 Tax=Geminicoccus sp. TaxID=2024832 RepID=UPI002E2FCDDB|nr:aldo/keto reductase [Geminicoccus sp.]HEX2525651.1 aldo/keto reductase [Geminicoccus sp.]